MLIFYTMIFIDNERNFEKLLLTILVIYFQFLLNIRFFINLYLYLYLFKKQFNNSVPIIGNILGAGYTYFHPGVKFNLIE